MDLLRPMKVSQSSFLKVGQQCLAIGNPFRGGVVDLVVVRVVVVVAVVVGVGLRKGQT
ncbi:hypothetical protein HanHA300_Chr16g0617891 [Helianthus annuus]|nr:hypothetical protein HanHA300_Chr16g0617891 [Helianthus annuus]KAJ0443657.1 hypothetical protein HanIR_Chr16g0823191 [Helianthus annuus]KAJ0461125.1 hypothetical protein HanHA89_Chr16g0668781 [Helianthus annuus]KAJ0641545.1 hypothetical protein HanLR1_Chr16g0628441 [Helianthus annuus]